MLHHRHAGCADSPLQRGGDAVAVATLRVAPAKKAERLASAHGDLRTLVKNVQLRGLVGGVETVTLGDEAAKKQNKNSKLSAQRAGEPTFDVEMANEDNGATVAPDPEGKYQLPLEPEVVSAAATRIADRLHRGV